MVRADLLTIIMVIIVILQFMRNSKAVGVLWGIFTVCYTVLIVVVFLQVNTQYRELVRNIEQCKQFSVSYVLSTVTSRARAVKST